MQDVCASELLGLSSSLLAMKLLHHTKRRLGTIDVVLHRAAADANRTHDRSVHFDGKADTVGSHPRYLRNAREERRLALDEIEEVLRRESEEPCICFVLCNLDGKNGRAVHPAESLQIAAVIENRNVFRNSNGPWPWQGPCRPSSGQVRLRHCFLNNICHRSLLQFAVREIAFGPFGALARSLKPKACVSEGAE
jgi:hypothetical protein